MTLHPGRPFAFEADPELSNTPTYERPTCLGRVRDRRVGYAGFAEFSFVDASAFNSPLAEFLSRLSRSVDSSSRFNERHRPFFDLNFWIFVFFDARTHREVFLFEATGLLE